MYIRKAIRDKYRTRVIGLFKLASKVRGEKTYSNFKRELIEVKSLIKLEVLNKV